MGALNRKKEEEAVARGYELGIEHAKQVAAAVADGYRGGRLGTVFTPDESGLAEQVAVEVGSKIEARADDYRFSYDTPGDPFKKGP